MNRLVCIAVFLLALSPVAAFAAGSGNGSGGGYKPPPPAPRPVAPAPRTSTAPKPPPVAPKAAPKTSTTAPKPAAPKTSTAGTKTIQTSCCGTVSYPSGSRQRSYGSTVYYVSPHYGWYGHSFYYGYPYPYYYWNCWGCYGAPYWGDYYLGSAEVTPTPSWIVLGVVGLLLIGFATFMWRRQRAAE